MRLVHHPLAQSLTNEFSAKLKNKNKKKVNLNNVVGRCHWCANVYHGKVFTKRAISLSLAAT